MSISVQKPLIQLRKKGKGNQRSVVLYVPHNLCACHTELLTMHTLKQIIQKRELCLQKILLSPIPSKRFTTNTPNSRATYLNTAQPTQSGFRTSAHVAFHTGKSKRRKGDVLIFISFIQI